MPDLEQQLWEQYGYWGEHPTYPVADWQYEVANNDTRESYWHWVANAIMNDDDTSEYERRIKGATK